MFKNEETSRKKIVPIKVIIIICTLIMLLVLFIVPASAYVRPEFNDGIAGGWHPGRFCIPCHYTIAGTEKAKAIDRNCDNCHGYRAKGPDFNSKKIVMSNIVNIHNDMVCIRCHVGLKSQTNITAADFHRVMSKTACLSCHTFQNGTYIKPSKTKCSECHGDPHVAHGKKLEKLCVACHGEFGEQYANKSLEPGDKMMPSSLSNISRISESNRSEYTTIGQLIIKLIEQLTQILR